MKVEIRKLTPAILNDYLHFFETDAHYVNNGMIQGYLAHADEKVVGWCNANTKSDCLNCTSWLRFKTLVNITESTPEIKVKSIFCFVIAPDMKRKGIATQFLERVCQDAANDGFDYVEAYPDQQFTNTFNANMGPLALYIKSGFVIHQEVNDKYKGIYDMKYFVVRKQLR